MNGQCLCGETTFEVELKNHDVHVCHCSMCRRQTSGVIMTVDVVKGSLKFIQQSILVYLTLLNGVKEAFVTLVEQQFFGEQKIKVTAISMCFL